MGGHTLIPDITSFMEPVAPLPNTPRVRRRLSIAILIVSVLLAVDGIIFLVINQITKGMIPEPIKLTLAIIALMLFCVLAIFLKTAAETVRSKADESLAKAEKLQDDLGKKKEDTDFFTSLIDINFKYINAYYRQTQEHAEKSFGLSVFAAIVGLGTVIAGIALMYFDKTTPGFVTTAAGVIAEFISAVMFYLYNRTVLKMGEYHHKLVLTQNIALALKVSDDLEGEAKTEAKKLLISALTQDINRFLSSTSTEITNRKSISTGASHD